MNTPEKNISHREEVVQMINIDHEIKKKSFEQIARKSFLMRPEKFKQKSELRDYLLDCEKRHQIKTRESREPFFSTWRLRYYLSKNIDFLSYLLIELNALTLVQPFFTIKTRMQAKNKLIDVTHYLKNNVEKKSIYAGLSHSYGLCLLHFGMFINIKRITSKWTEEKGGFLSQESVNLFNFFASDLMTLPLRLFLETRRTLFQMGNTSVSLQETFFKCRQSAVPVFFRDFVFRVAVYSILAKEDLKKTKTQRFKEIGATLFLACLISNPLDVVCTKIFSQKIETYTSLLQTLKLVSTQEGNGKFLTGLSMRFSALTIATLCNFLLFDFLRGFLGESFSDDSLLN